MMEVLKLPETRHFQNDYSDCIFKMIFYFF